MNMFPAPPGTTCVTGVVTVFESALLGAVNGVVSPVVGQPVFFTQVVGPAGGMVSLSDLNRQFATVCGTFTTQNGRPVLNVTFAAPASGTIPVQQSTVFAAPTGVTVPAQQGVAFQAPAGIGAAGTQQQALIARLIQLLQFLRNR